MLIKGADTIADTYPFPAKIVAKNSTLTLQERGCYFFMVDIFQNGDNKNCKSKQHHKFFICTHRKLGI